jgi:putative membrane protein
MACQEVIVKHALVYLLVLSPLTVWGADKNPDETFFKHAAEGGIAEVEAGKLAQSKGHSDAVKEFGAMMVKDHEAANTKLKSIAAGENVDLPGTSSAQQMASKGKLEVLTGETFDKAYIKNQITAHEKTAALFKKEIASGSDAQAKAFAKETLPTVQAHLKKIKEIASAAGVTTK